jgi:hypothetical protein
VLSAVGWPCGGLQAPDEDQSDEESNWSPRVTFRSACFRIEKNVQVRDPAYLWEVGGRLEQIVKKIGQHN